MPGPTHYTVWEGFGAKISHQYEAVRNQQEATHRTVLSPEPDTMVLPSGLMATLHTLSVCPLSVLLTSPDARSHTLARVGRLCGRVSEPKLVITTKQISSQHEATHRTVPSSEPDTMVLPSGLMATLLT